MSCFWSGLFDDDDDVFVIDLALLNAEKCKKNFITNLGGEVFVSQIVLIECGWSKGHDKGLKSLKLICILMPIKKTKVRLKCLDAVSYKRGRSL